MTRGCPRRSADPLWYPRERWGRWGSGGAARGPIWIEPDRRRRERLRRNNKGRHRCEDRQEVEVCPTHPPLLYPIPPHCTALLWVLLWIDPASSWSFDGRPMRRAEADPTQDCRQQAATPLRGDLHCWDCVRPEKSCPVVPHNHHLHMLRHLHLHRLVKVQDKFDVLGILLCRLLFIGILHLSSHRKTLL